MRHQKSGRHLNRTAAHRKAMFGNMAVSLIEHEVIRTTLPKAKELRRTIEPLITLAKEDSVANRRLAFSKLRDKAAVGKLFHDIGPRFSARPGGYTRILKDGYRAGDSTLAAYIELVDRVREFESDDEIEDVEDTTTGEAEAAAPVPVSDAGSDSDVDTASTSDESGSDEPQALEEPPQTAAEIETEAEAETEADLETEAANTQESHADSAVAEDLSDTSNDDTPAVDVDPSADKSPEDPKSS